MEGLFSLGPISYCLTAVGLWIGMTGKYSEQEIDSLLSIFAFFLTAPIMLIVAYFGDGMSSETPEILLTIGKVFSFLVYAGIVWLPIYGALRLFNRFFG